jgi:hypothetical protein
VGAIDFDTCAPGPRLWDIAYTAYRFVPLMPGPEDADPRGAGERSPFGLAAMLARLNIFLDTYSAFGAPMRYAPSTVIASSVERLHALAVWTTWHARTNGVLALVQHADLYLAHARWLAARLGTT